MNYDDRVVCFLDFLGFSAQIASTLDAEGRDVSSEIERIASAIQRLRQITDADAPEDRPRMEVTQFSDSVVLSFEASSESGVFHSLLSILHAQMALVENGILCRGAVTRGKLVHTRTLLFGPAMNRAYDLETKAAVYPRVILDDEIVSTGGAAPARHHHADQEQEEIRDLLAQDADGFFYVDYITRGQGELNDPECDYPEYLSRLRQIAVSGVTLADRSVAMKYRWLAEKLNAHFAVVRQSASQRLNDRELSEPYMRLSPIPLAS